jgi:hypothetical protein
MLSLRDVRCQSCERSVRPPRVAPGQYSGGHDAHKASTRRQHTHLAYVMRVDNCEGVRSVRHGPLLPEASLLKMLMRSGCASHAWLA